MLMPEIRKQLDEADKMWAYIKNTCRLKMKSKIAMRKSCLTSL